MMTDIYKKRFSELRQQMEELLASKKPTYDSYLEKVNSTLIQTLRKRVYNASRSQQRCASNEGAP